MWTLDEVARVLLLAASLFYLARPTGGIQGRGSRSVLKRARLEERDRRGGWAALCIGH